MRRTIKTFVCNEVKGLINSLNSFKKLDNCELISGVWGGDV